jgi:predicted  nucleic acid-binding Zn-ribbon protein
MEMADLKHDLNVLVVVSKVDSTLTEYRGELSRLPEKLTWAQQALAKVEDAEQKAIADFETKKKERRHLETLLQDHEAKIKKFHGDLMQASSNKEYQACQKEIATLKTEIDTKEERLLVLMDELDDHRADHEARLKTIAEDKAARQTVIEAITERTAFLENEIKSLESKKPGYLKEIDPALKKRYERIEANLGSLAATRTDDGNCGGCGAKLPPQLVVEVRSNDKIILCQTCGRILIHYVD